MPFKLNADRRHYIPKQKFKVTNWCDYDASLHHRIWQDVYRPKAGGTELYVKVTLDAQRALFLISFKEA